MEATSSREKIPCTFNLQQDTKVCFFCRFLTLVVQPTSVSSVAECARNIFPTIKLQGGFVNFFSSVRVTSALAEHCPQFEASTLLEVRTATLAEFERVEKLLTRGPDERWV